MPFESMLRKIYLLMLSLLILCAASGRAQTEARDGAPNVILVLTDDQGWWDLGIHGNPYLETPAMDHLAQEGVRFTHFYVSPVCAPTRAALLTGRHYQRTGAVDTYLGRDTMRAEEVTLAEVFKEHGYQTALVGKWHLGRYFRYHPNNQGFDDFFGFWQFALMNRYFDSDELFHNREPVITTGYITDVLTDRAIQSIKTNAHRPFFLYLAYNAPHGPYRVPDQYIEKYLEKGLPLRESRIYGMITSIDDNLKRLLDTVEEQGIDQNTIVIFMGDNGGMSRYFKAGLRGEKAYIYEGGLRVPFIARWPGRFPAGAVVDAQAQHIDIFPTLCELVGIPAPDGVKLDGKSIVSLLQEGKGSSPHSHLFHQWNRVQPVFELPTPPIPLVAPAAAIIAPYTLGAAPFWAVQDTRTRFKLIRTTDSLAGKMESRDELYDLEHDPGESRDIAAEHPETVKELRRHFERWFNDITSGLDWSRVPIEIGRSEENPVEIELLWGEPVGQNVKLTFRRFYRDTIDHWTDIDTSVRWGIDVTRPGRYQVTLSYGCRAEDAGSTVLVKVGEAELEHVVEATAGENVYRPLTVGVLLLSKGPAELEIGPRSIVGDELMVLHKIWLERLD